MLRVYIWLVSIVSKLLNVSKQWTVLDNAYVNIKELEMERIKLLWSLPGTHTLFFKDCMLIPRTAVV